MSIKNKTVSFVLAIVLLLGMQVTAFAKPATGSITFEKVNITVPVGGTVNVGITYSDDIDDKDMRNPYFSEQERGIVDVDFMETKNGVDIEYASITGLKEGKTTVYLYAGRVSGRIQVTVGRGDSASSGTASKTQAVSKEEETLIANDKSALGAALDAALKKATSKKREVMINATDETISRDTLKALAARAKAAKKYAVIVVDSRDSNKEVVAKLYVEPDKLKSIKTADFKTGVSIDSTRKAALEKSYSNKLWVVRCAQSGSFGGSLEIAVKLGGLPKDVSKLAVYNVDANGKFSKIEEPSCFVEKDGLLHFFSKQAGEIVISDGALAKK